MALTAIFCTLGSRGSQNAIANGETRTLNLFHSHTKESAQITFMRNGAYDPEALQRLNWLLRDWRKDEPIKMDPQLFDLVWAAYREVGSHEPIVIMSAYRSPGTNAMLRRRSSAVAKNSQHMAGKAMDIHLTDVSMQTVREVGLRLQRGGVGYYPTAGSPFVHLDTGTVRHWPRVTHEYLARLFPDGKTVHIPTDGQPLSGYAEAAAEIAERGGSAIALADLNSSRGKSFWASLFGGGNDDEDDDRPVAKGRGGNTRVAALASAQAPSPSSGDDNGVRSFQMAASGYAQPSARASAAPIPDKQLRLQQPAPTSASAPQFALASASQTTATADDLAALNAKGQLLPRTATKQTELVALAAGSSLPPAAPLAAGQFSLANIPMPPHRPTDLASSIPLPPVKPVQVATATSAAPANAPVSDASPHSLPSAIFGGAGAALPQTAAAYASPDGIPLPPARIKTAVAPVAASVVASVLPAAAAPAPSPRPASSEDNAHPRFSIDYGVKLDRMGLTTLVSRVASENDVVRPTGQMAPPSTRTAFGGQTTGVTYGSRLSSTAIRPIGTRFSGSALD